MNSQALNALISWGKSRSKQHFCSSITTAGAKTIATWLVLRLGGTNPPPPPPGGETRNPQLRQDYRIIPSMSQTCLKFWDKFETKLRTDLRPYRDNFETYLTILLLRANWDIFETWVHSVILFGHISKTFYTMLHSWLVSFKENSRYRIFTNKINILFLPSYA